MRLIFPSIAQADKYAYTYDTNAEWRWHNRGTRVHECFGFYETYGHGQTAHSPDYAVQVGMYADYLASLARHLLEHPELCRELELTFCDVVTARAIEFAHGLKPKEGKDLYFSLDDTKYNRRTGEYEFPLTSNREKRYDNRYREVAAWMDGSFDAVFGILCKDWYGVHQRYMLAREIAEWFAKTPGVWCDSQAAETLMKFPEVAGTVECYRWALDAVKGQTRAWRMREVADGQLRNYTRRIEDAAKRAADEQAADATGKEVA